jgi:hypothetical protein
MDTVSRLETAVPDDRARIPEVAARGEAGRRAVWFAAGVRVLVMTWLAGGNLPPLQDCESNDRPRSVA